MPQINILNLLEGDNQSVIVDKLNYNFDQILSAGGGPQGIRGLIGPTGPIGPQGPQGTQGIQGLQGSKWFVQDFPQPLGPTSITGSNPASFPNIGDYWLDIDSPNQDILIYLGGTAGWTQTGYGLAQGDVFQRVTPVQFQGGGTGSAIMIAGTGASIDSVVLSDRNITEYSSPSVTGLNYENAKLKISTENRDRLISFGKSDYESIGAGAATGMIFNPYIGWSGSSTYNLEITNPTGSVKIRSIATTGSSGQGVNIEAVGINGEVTLTSVNSYIMASPGGNNGMYIDIGTAGTGWLEVSNQTSSTPSTQSGAYLYADSYGAGIGFGKQDLTGDRKKLSVNGNLSVGGDLSWQTSAISGSSEVSPMYSPTGNSGIGGSTGPYYILSQGYIGVGSLGSGARNTSSGPSVSGSPYNYADPRMWVVANSTDSAAPQAAAEFRSENTWTQNYPGRVQIGIGSPTQSGDLGLSSRIAQDIFFGITGTSSEEGSLSFDHRISVGGSKLARIFSSTTYFSGTGPSRSVINTTGSNKFLEIRATPSSTGGQVRIGVNGGTASQGPIILAVSGTGSGIPGPNSVSIGENAENFFSQNTTAAGYGGGSQSNQRNHRLSVQGGASFGISDSLTEGASTTGGWAHNSSKESGRFSILKIHRDRDTTPNTRDNNYPNGIEVSIKGSSSTGSSGSKNKSLSMLVWDNDSTLLGASDSAVPGFSISDSGRNVNIGSGFPTQNSLSITGNISGNPASFCMGDYTFVQTNGFIGPANGARIQGSVVVGNTGSGGGASNPKLTILDDGVQSKGGLLVTSGTYLPVNSPGSDLDPASIAVEGRALIGGRSYIPSPGAGSTGARLVVVGGTSGSTVGSTGALIWTDTPGLSLGVNTTFRSEGPNINYTTEINKKDDAATFKLGWKPIKIEDLTSSSSPANPGSPIPPSSNTIFQVDGAGNTYSRRSVRTNSYHRNPRTSPLVPPSMTYTESSSNPGTWKIIQLGSNEDVICSGRNTYTGNTSGRTTQIIEYVNKSTESALSSTTISAVDYMESTANSTCLGWSRCDIIWTRIGDVVNCSFIIEDANGPDNSSASGAAGVKIPLPVMTRSGFNGFTTSYGSGANYTSGSLRPAEVKFTGSLAIDNSIYVIVSIPNSGGGSGTDGPIRGSFTYFLSYI